MSVSDVEIVKKGHLRYKLSGHYSENGVNVRSRRVIFFQIHNIRVGVPLFVNANYIVMCKHATLQE